MIGTRLYEEQDFDAAIQLAAAGALSLDQLITGVAPLGRVAETFATIDADPSGIKYLIDCQSESLT